jgi:hypothetical protein
MFVPSFCRHAPTTADRVRRSRRRPAPSRPTARLLGPEPLEDRTLLSFGFGWAFNVGGPGQDAATGITTDSSGDLYVTGWFMSSTVNFDPNNTNPRANSSNSPQLWQGP